MHTPHTTPHLRRGAWRLATVVLLALSMHAAQAMSIRELRALEKSDRKQGINYMRYYLVGVMEGVLQGHALGTRNGAAPRICLEGRRLQPAMALDLYQTELRRNADLYEADIPVELVLANALATVYPCP